MKALELKAELSKFLMANGPEGFAKLISDSIDESGPANGKSINRIRTDIVNKLIALNKLNLTDR